MRRLDNGDLTWRIQYLYEWLQKNARKGITNKEVLKEFPNYEDAWKALKRKKAFMFYEDGKWFTWY